jgi:uncharacterized membrane protein YoaK (UPF0700 family)
MFPQHEPPVACGDVVEDVGNFTDTRGTQPRTDPDTLPAQCFLVANFCRSSTHVSCINPFSLLQMKPSCYGRAVVLSLPYAAFVATTCSVITMANEAHNGATKKTPSTSHMTLGAPVIPNSTHSPRSDLLKHLCSPIRVTVFAEVQLLLLTFCTGIQDATTFPDYHCFASNQTGNTVMLAMSVALPELADHLFVTTNIGLSLGLFLAGGLITGQLSHIIGPRSRLWLLLSNLVQTALIFGAAELQYASGVGLKGPQASAVIILLAFASGSQVVLSRSLAMTEISTAMATAAWVDLLIDPQLWGLKNRSRNRRAAFLVTLFAGSFAGAFMYRNVGSASTLVVSAVGKLLVTVLFLLNESECKEVACDD